MKSFKAAAWMLPFLLSAGTLSAAETATNSLPATEAVIEPVMEKIEDKVLLNAYRNLAGGTHEEKQKALAVLDENYRNPAVYGIIVKLLTYYFDVPRFREDDEAMYRNDAIAEKLIRILGKTRNPEAFSVYLKFVMNPLGHRSDTVKASWKAMAEIDWNKK